MPHAEVFFAETRSRHDVPIADDAEAWIAGLVAEVRTNAARTGPPPPLVDSPKCPRCSLVGVCLPDEVNLLRDRTAEKPRRLVARDDPRSPLYVMTPGAFVRQKGGRLELEHQGEKVASRRLLDVAHVAVFGNVTISSGAVRACLEQDTPILWFTSGGWLSGYAIAHGGSWVARRMAQTMLALDPARGAVAAAMIAGKLRNQRTLLRRLGGETQRDAASQLTDLARTAEAESDPASLLGLEGTGARIYFDGFPSLLKRHGDEFRFEGRNRRPPTDRVNAMLSFAYALLVRDTTVACLAAGLDPQVGLLHRPRHGRPSLALDLAEEFRPLVGDSTVVTAINNGELRPRDFVQRGGAVALTDAGRKRVIAAYERRVAVTLEHPLYGYRVSYRRAMELQARQLAAVIDGQLEGYRPLTTR
uniref:CRISPR-associated endonuclease Cas1 n=1 Tax=Patulibacter defluvii TaxID=3095358 RepID=UPI0035C90254